MKETLAQNIRQIYGDAVAYIKLQIEESKLAGAEKASVLLSSVAVCAICFALGMFTVFLFSLALVSMFKSSMSEWMAYMLVGGILLVLLLIVILLRKQLIIDPVCRFLTKLIFDKGSK